MHQVHAVNAAWEWCYTSQNEERIEDRNAAVKQKTNKRHKSLVLILVWAWTWYWEEKAYAPIHPVIMSPFPVSFPSFLRPVSYLGWKWWDILSCSVDNAREPIVKGAAAKNQSHASNSVVTKFLSEEEKARKLCATLRAAVTTMWLIGGYMSWRWLRQQSGVPTTLQALRYHRVRV